MTLEKEPKGNAGLKKLPATERLKSKKIIEELFKKGSSVYLHPFRLIYSPTQVAPTQYPRILVSVPKRIYKKAVDRNRLRRQIKEAWRLNKSLIFTGQWKIVPEYCIFIYTSKEKLPFKTIEKKLILILGCLEQDKPHKT